ncbi:hypothetical protein [Bacillus cereus]|uniref:hypothetical protein n=1 Tax=Bacillus cereus TaxID=1396 RepID=UPI001CFC6916
MLLIAKDIEPDALRQDREDGNSFKGKRCGKELNDALIKNQGYLCVYCMKRIELPAVRVEHYKPRRHKELVLVYDNLFLACPGNEGKGAARHTCDVKKGDNEIQIDPLNPVHIKQIQYGSGGNIFSTIEEHNDDLNVILNLNEAELLRIRKMYYDIIAKKIQRAKQDGELSYNFLSGLLLKYRRKKEEELLPFCGVAIGYIEREMEAMREVGS